MKKNDYTNPVYSGALTFRDSKPIPEMWVELHNDADHWCNMPFASNRKDDRDYLDSRSNNTLIIFKEITAKRWSSLCSAVGWTVYGAVALSWCEGAKIEDVWAGWLASGFPLKPLPEFERPARFINPALLPQTNKSGEINATMKEVSPNSETYQLAVCATIAALKESLEFELEPNGYKGAMPQIAAFLKSRMLQKPDKTPEENAIIDVWSEKIKGTEWDIWNKESA